jgi:hypothetical protein
MTLPVVILYHYIIVALSARLHIRVQCVFLTGLTVISLNKTETQVEYLIYSKNVDMFEMYSFFLGIYYIIA